MNFDQMVSVVFWVGMVGMGGILLLATVAITMSFIHENEDPRITEVRVQRKVDRMQRRDAQMVRMRSMGEQQ